MFDSPETRNRDFHNPKVALAAAGEVTAGLVDMRQRLQGTLNETAEAAQRHGQFPDTKAVALQHRGDSLNLEDRIEARDLLGKDAMEPFGIYAHVGKESLKAEGAEVIPIHPESEVEQPERLEPAA